MKKWSLAVPMLCLLLAPGLLMARSKKPSVPEVFARARTAYVEAVEGQQFDRDLAPEEREAIADVQDALQAWKRYRLVTQREDADVVFVVRKGRVMEPDGTGDLGNPNQSPAPGGPMGEPGVAGGPLPAQRVPAPVMGPGVTEDLLEVCTVNSNGKLSRPLWARTFEDGLSSPQVLLFRQFRDEVDKAYPIPPVNPAAGAGTRQ